MKSSEYKARPVGYYERIDIVLELSILKSRTLLKFFYASILLLKST